MDAGFWLERAEAAMSPDGYEHRLLAGAVIQGSAPDQLFYVRANHVWAQWTTLTREAALRHIREIARNQAELGARDALIWC